jgi:hypothetical protein
MWSSSHSRRLRGSRILAFICPNVHYDHLLDSCFALVVIYFCHTRTRYASATPCYRVTQSPHRQRRRPRWYRTPSRVPARPRAAHTSFRASHSSLDCLLIVYRCTRTHSPHHPAWDCHLSPDCLFIVYHTRTLTPATTSSLTGPLVPRLFAPDVPVYPYTLAAAAWPDHPLLFQLITTICRSCGS